MTEKIAVMQNPNEFRDPLIMAQAVSDAGFERAMAYFKNPRMGGGDFTKDWLKAMGIHSRERATRANEAAVLLSVAKLGGLSGEALEPLWNHLTGKAPPAKRIRENSNADTAATNANQALTVDAKA